MCKTESIFSLTSSPLRLPWPIGRGSILLVFAFVQAFLVACSGDDSTSGNDVESSDDSYSLEASSSSIGSSSSSSEESSSSGMFVVDERDGQVYRTVVIGDQEWMAENLNYDAPNSRCVNDSCKYGRAYTWGSAMDSMGVFSKNGEACGGSVTCSPAYPVQGLCMKGWHLPSDSEWNVLLSMAGDDVAESLSFEEKTFFWSSAEVTVGNYERAHGSWLGNDEYAADLVLILRRDYYPVRCVKGAASDDTSFIGKLRSPSGKQYVTFGTMTDERDGQTYKTVTINNQTWMAENLNYAYLQPTSTLDSSSWCYDNDPENCETYGRLYLWSAAVDSAALFSEGGKGCGYGSDEIYCAVGKPSPSPCHNLENAPIRGVCPAGWHMPSHEEWSKLFLKPDYFSSSPLKSRKGWEQGRSGTDDYGFEALPSGFGGLSDYSTIRFYLRGKTTGFWTRDNLNRVLDFAWEDVEYDFWMDEWTSLPALPIRCIKDE